MRWWRVRATMRRTGSRATGTRPTTGGAAGELRERNRPGERLTTTYDALGNLLTATVQPLVNGSPVGAPPATTVGYRVDGESRRVARSVNGVRERGWLYRDGISPVA